MANPRDLGFDRDVHRKIDEAAERLKDAEALVIAAAGDIWRHSEALASSYAKEEGRDEVVDVAIRALVDAPYGMLGQYVSDLRRLRESLGVAVRFYTGPMSHWLWAEKYGKDRDADQRESA